VNDLETIVSLLDYTSLGCDDTEATIDAFCERASTPLGWVAAVCVWPRFVERCVRNLEHTGIPVAGVANFPSGDDGMEAAIVETENIIQAGGQEVDLVMPYRQWLAGQREQCAELIQAVRKTCGSGVLLKVIIESGALGDAGTIRRASRDAIDAGASFIKTSTGKIGIGATPEAARSMLEAIKVSDLGIGFKASGGIRTLTQAREYMRLAADVMGVDYLAPETFRIGASGLLVDVLKASRSD